LQYTKNLKTLKLEDLHLFSEELLREFCRIHDLELEGCMFESSYHEKNGGAMLSQADFFIQKN